MNTGLRASWCYGVQRPADRSDEGGMVSTTRVVDNQAWEIETGSLIVRLINFMDIIIVDHPRSSVVYIISVVSVCLSVCLSNDFESVFDAGSLYPHMRYISAALKFLQDLRRDSG